MNGNKKTPFVTIGEKEIRVDVARTNRLAVREHLATGNPLTELESVVLFGVTSLTDLVSSLRKEGWVFNSRRVTFARALRRINEHAVLTPPCELPIREIHLTEWWIAK